MDYLLDTNIFNWLVDDRLKPADLPSDGRLLITHNQIAEINKTADGERRERLLLVMVAARVELVPAAVTVLGSARLGHTELGDGTQYDRLKAALDAKNRRKPNNVIDAIAGATALAKRYTLLTADSDLADFTRWLSAKYSIESR